ncbi:hypothetical protein PACILC2_15040 [Paenibacillus cisolokensis]|uniref:DUF3990 domain-containing protein n=1 Tax=Paenibacillus cisolokensis TaxID=1658519 RepID=A0ABQ4N446_9BACL|nr:DUF3990 domain-containing protein [Paenibacillus cisolokensis]GIQ62936.1 hypothetical protein PACILC2_15040 [Paenibacillus cisolokensis]
MDIITPQLLYHGTVAAHIESFLGKLLDSRYWRPGRDFGEGFYTTVSAAQARDWAHRVAKQSLVATSPCVLVIELLAIPPGIEPLIFCRILPDGHRLFLSIVRLIRKEATHASGIRTW